QKNLRRPIENTKPPKSPFVARALPELVYPILRPLGSYWIRTGYAATFYHLSEPCFWHIQHHNLQLADPPRNPPRWKQWFLLLKNRSLAKPGFRILIGTRSMRHLRKPCRTPHAERFHVLPQN